MGENKLRRKGILIVVSGFAGCGKGTLMKCLLRDYENYALSVSMTTRKPRPGEIHGREYFFVSREEFEKKIEEDGLIEYACYVENYYGTPRAYVEEKMAEGKDVILEIEIQGALKIKKRFPDSILIFVMPPSAEVLYERLMNRGTESPEVIEKRMRRAAEESQGIEEYDYIVVNDELEACADRIHQIICSAHSTPERNEEFIQNIRKDLGRIWKGEK